MKKPFLFALVAIAMCACSESTMMNEPDNPVLSRSNEQTPTVSYSVTPDMVCKYLNIARKGKTIDSITPVIEDGDTLAYVAQYTGNNGWDLISGDKRVAPVLASANSGILNLNDTINPAVKALNGMVQIVLDTKNGTDSIKDKMWEFLEPKEVVKSNRPQQRGNGTGKWIAVDTTYENNTTTQPHIITTKWGQGSPWNQVTPRINNTYTYVGCVPVAAGQIIYHYRKNNARDIAIPTTIEHEINGDVSFYNFTTNSWNNLELNSNQAYMYNYSGIFMSYLGSLLGTEHGIEGSPTDVENVPPILTQFKLSFSTSTSYNYNTIISNLRALKPVYISCSVRNKPDSGHSFIIDGYEYSVERLYITYMWDPNYELEDWESPYGEPAETDKDGYAWREEELNGYETCRFMMNWGWAGSCDNYTYLVYRRQNNSSQYYDVNWNANNNTYNVFSKMFYNISEAE